MSTVDSGMARPRWVARFARLPIRIRLTIAFAAVMLAVLGAAGAVLYVQFQRDLDSELDAGLKDQAADIGALVKAGKGPGIVTSSRERLAQIYGPDGRVLASTPAAARIRLLSRAQVGEARGLTKTRTGTFDTRSIGMAKVNRALNNP